MGVNLRRRYVGVPQQFLDAAQIRPIGEKVAGEGVPQDMRAYL